MARCQITGYLYNAIGSPVTTGSLYIRLQQDIVQDGVKIAPFTYTINLATTSGYVDVSLYPNVGASPAGTAYQVWYDPDPTDLSKPVYAKDGYWENWWSVPQSASVPLGSFVSAERGEPYANYMPLSGTLSSLPEFLLLGSTAANTNKGFNANQVGVNKPGVRYNASLSRWETSNNGTTWSEMLNAATALGASTAFGGDVTGTYNAIALAATGVSAGTYGSASLVPIITVDAKGRVTSVTTTSVSGGGGGSASGTAGGDLSGTYPNPTVIALRGKPVSSVLPTASGQVLVWDNPANQWVPSTDGTGLLLNAANLASGTVPLARISGLTNTQIAAGAAIAWSKVDKTGAALADFPGSVSIGQLPASVIIADGTRTFGPTATTGVGVGISSTVLTSGSLLRLTGPDSGFTGLYLDLRNQTGTQRFAIDSTGKITIGTIDYANVTNRSIVNADVSGSAAIAYSKLNLVGGIVNADVSASAAIAWSKLSKTGSNLTDIATRVITDTTGQLPYARLTLTGSILDADVATAAAIGWSKISKTGANITDIPTRAITDLTGNLPYARVTLTGSVVDADVSASAAIGWSKISKTGSSLADLVTRAISDTTGTLAAARGGTGTTTSPTLNGLAYGTGSALAYTAAGTMGQVIRAGATGVPEWADPAATTGHALLSGGHTDVTAAAVARGALIVGQGAVPTWSRLTIGAAGSFLTSNGTDVSWSNTLANIDITLNNGSSSAPSIRFASATTSGFYNAGLAAFYSVVSGSAHATFQTGTTAGGAIHVLSANGLVALQLGNGSTTGLTVSQLSAALRFNGSGVAWGDLAYFPNGTRATGGHFRFNLAASSVGTGSTGILSVGSFLASDTSSLLTPAYSFTSATDAGLSYNLGTIALVSGGVARVVINSTGLGVGITPNYPVHVSAGTVGTTQYNSSVKSRLAMSSGNNMYFDTSLYRHTNGASWESAGVRLQLTVDASPMSYIEFNPTKPGSNTSSLGFGFNLTESMRLTDDGRLGINTTLPIAKLDVSSTHMVVGEPGGLWDVGAIQFGRGVNGPNGTFCISNESGELTFHQYANATRVTRAKMSQQGDWSLLGQSGRAYAFSYSDRATVDGVSVANYGMTFGAGGTYHVGLSGWGGIAFFSGGTKKMEMSQAGNLGVGLIDAQSRLHVVGSGSLPSLNYNAANIAQFSNGLTQLAINVDPNYPFGASLQVRHATLNGLAYPLNLQPLGGNVGIGLQDPGQKLVVVGGFHVAGSASLGTTGPAGIVSYEYPSIRHYIGDGTGYSFKLSSRVSSTTTDRLTVKDNGEVHLGNGTPAVGDTATLFAGKHKTYENSLSIASGTATTMATFPNTNSAWLITTTISANDGPGNYMNVGLLRISNGSAIYTAIVTSGFLTVGMSGLSVQLTQSTGGAQTGQISAMRLH